jgi:2-keto-4-pentenoate hydratase
MSIPGEVGQALLVPLRTSLRHAARTGVPRIMTNDDRSARAIRLLLAARASRERLPELPAAARPSTAADAYRIQDGVVRELGPIAGWKVGAKSQDGEPTCAPIATTSRHASPASFARGTFALNGIEAELAFTLARDLPPRLRAYDARDLVAAVAAVHPAIEVVESRYVDPQRVDALSLLADFVSHGALVVGPGVALPQGFDVRAQRVELDIDGKRAVTDVNGNPAGDPFRLLAWLANHVASRCGGLRRGNVVTTGSWTGLKIAPQGAAVLARFPGIGEARITATT